MTKTSALTTLKPERFSTTAEIYADECAAVAEQLNYSAQYFPQQHLALSAGPAAWESGSPAALAIYYPTLTGAWRTVVSFAIELQDETTELLVGAQSEIAAGEEVELRVTVTPELGIGTPLTAAVIAFDDGDNGAELTATIDVSSLGPSGAGSERECHVEIEVQTTNAEAGVSWLRSFRLEDAPLAVLPSPPDE